MKMRKRVINHFADTIFWYILYFLPVLAYLMFVISAPFVDLSSSEDVSLDDYTVQNVVTFPIGSTFFVSDANVSSFLEPLYFSYRLTGESEDFVSVVLFVPSEADIASFQNLYNIVVVDVSSTDDGYLATLTRPFSFVVPSDFIFDPSENFILSPVGGSGLFSYTFEQANFSTEYVYNRIPSISLSSYDFKTFVNSMGFEFATDNIIVNSLSDIFGTDGIMPMFDNDTPFIIFAWFIGVYLLHLLVDFLLFIPRMAHKWMKDCTGGD